MLSSFTKDLIAELRDFVWDKMEDISILDEKIKKKDTEMQRLEMELLLHHHLGMEMQQKGKKDGSIAERRRYQRPRPIIAGTPG